MKKKWYQGWFEYTPWPILGGIIACLGILWYFVNKLSPISDMTPNQIDNVFGQGVVVIIILLLSGLVQILRKSDRLK